MARQPIAQKKMERVQVNAEDGMSSLQDHIRSKAFEARQKYASPTGEIPYRTFLNMLDDRTVVRNSVHVVYDSDSLEPGEFAWMCQAGESPSDGFVCYVHPIYRENKEEVVALIAYHLVVVNYGEIATAEEAELFGATLLGMDVETYYNQICALADRLAHGACGG